MSKFKVGDKVRVVKNNSSARAKDDYIGEVYKIRNLQGERGDDTRYGIGQCHVVYESEVIPVNTQKIVITSDGEITLARLYDGKKVIRTAQTKCASDDEFDFETGAKIAFDRLVNPEPVEEKPEYFEGRAVCVKSYSSHPWTVGKSYIFASGRTKADDGRVLPELLDAFKEDDLSDITLIGARFVPLIMEDKTC